MRDQDMSTIHALVVEGDEALTLVEFCSACAVHAERVIELVEEGIIDPAGGAPGRWRFSSASIYRARAALRLRRDLGVNLAGVAVILELREEVVRLRRQLERGRRTTE